MRRTTLLFAVCAFCLISSFNVSASWAAQVGSLPEGQLSAREMSRLAFNSTAEIEYAKSGETALAYFSPNGELHLVKDDILNKGHWKVREKSNRFCTKLGDSSWSCRLLLSAEDGVRQYVAKKSGNHKHELTYKKFHPGKQLYALHKAPILPPGTLQKKQVKKLFSDKTVVSVTAKKKRKSLTYYAPDGTLEQTRDGLRRFGKWRVTDNGRICLQIENSKEKCRIIVKEGATYKKYIVKKNGHHQHSVSYQKFMHGRQL